MPSTSWATGLEYVVTDADQAAAPLKAARLFQRWKKVHTPSGAIARIDARRARTKLRWAAVGAVVADMVDRHLGDRAPPWQGATPPVARDQTRGAAGGVPVALSPSAPVGRRGWAACPH